VIEYEEKKLLLKMIGEKKKNTAIGGG